MCGGPVSHNLAIGKDDDARRRLGREFDVIKIDAYRRALKNLVRPDDVVIDMGCGTGLLGLLALEAGAAKVIAVDRGPIIELARETFEANGFGDRVAGSGGRTDRSQRVGLRLPRRSPSVGGDGRGSPRSRWTRTPTRRPSAQGYPSIHVAISMYTCIDFGSYFDAGAYGVVLGQV